MFNLVFSGGRCFKRTQFQWQPTLWVHDPAGPITLLHGNLDGGGGGTGGEPHFVGFDGVRFDYHGMERCWFRLWDGGGVLVDALFDLEPAAAKYPTFDHTTFITKLRITEDTSHQVYDLTYPWANAQPLKEAQKFGLVRGLPEKLQLIEGDLVGGLELETAIGLLVLTCMCFRGEFYFLNISFQLKPSVTDAAGILGQTLRPTKARIDNLDYLVSIGDP